MTKKAGQQNASSGVWTHEYVRTVRLKRIALDHSAIDAHSIILSFESDSYITVTTGSIMVLLYPGLEPGTSALGVLRAAIAPVKQLCIFVEIKKHTNTYTYGHNTCQSTSTHGWRTLDLASFSSHRVFFIPWHHPSYSTVHIGTIIKIITN